MDTGTINHFRNKLLQDKANLQQQLEFLQERGLNLSLRESTDELSSYDNHPGDLGTEVFERGKDIALKEHMLIQLHKIEDALNAINQGNYGTCQVCGAAIPLERLKAVPETTLCLKCRQDMEKEEGDKKSRPVEEEVVKPPFGHMYSHGNKEEQVIYDGEDTWQDLARTAEHAGESGSGSYYGPLDLDEDRSSVQDVEEIPYYKDEDGVIYQDFRTDTGAGIGPEERGG